MSYEWPGIKAARREARVAAMGCPPPPLRGRTKRLKRRLPDEPHPVDRPGDWLQWKADTLSRVAGPGGLSAARGLARARASYMARVAEVTGAPRVRRQADHGRDMIPQDEVVALEPALRSTALPWF